MHTDDNVLTTCTFFCETGRLIHYGLPHWKDIFFNRNSGSCGGIFCSNDQRLALLADSQRCVQRIKITREIKVANVRRFGTGFQNRSEYNEPRTIGNQNSGGN